MEYETAKNSSVEQLTPEEKIQKARERIERMPMHEVHKAQALKSLEEVYEATLTLAQTQEEPLLEPIQFPYSYNPRIEIEEIRQDGSSKLSIVQ